MSGNVPSRSSGFVSGTSAINTSDEESGRQIQFENSASSRRSSVDSRSTSASVLSDTFISFIENHTKPYKRDYDDLATSYLCTDLPFDRIICEDSNSYKDIPCPFPNPVPLESFLVQQTSRQNMGPSLRKARIIPSTRWIWNDLQCKLPLFKDTDDTERLTYLYGKVRQWCEVNKALSMDHKYPKPDPNIMRKQYSKPHQKAAKQARKESGISISKKNPIYQCGPLAAFSKHFVQSILQPNSFPADNYYTSYDPDVWDGQELDEEQKGRWGKWAESLAHIFEEIQPLEDLQTKETHWQAQALKTVDHRSHVKPTKKRFWRRNIYPPMTLEDYIREKRQLLPPIKPENLQTDYLSGIWEPELMNMEFEITPLNYDSRIDLAREGEPDPISWWVSHEAKQKCWQWLQNIPSTL